MENILEEPKPAELPELDEEAILRDQKKLRKTRLYYAMEIGELLLISGAEVGRVEGTIRRICLAYGAMRADVFTITSSIVTTVYYDNNEIYTQTRRVFLRSNDFTMVDRLNALSRQICREKPSCDEICAKLHAIRSEKQYPASAKIAAFMLVSASFTAFFGGSIPDVIASALVGLALKVFEYVCLTGLANAMVVSFLCSLAGGLLSNLLVCAGIGADPSLISIGNIMLYIPGIAMTNSLRDMFSGETITGMISFLQAILLAMVIGIGFALTNRMFAPVLAETAAAALDPRMVQLASSFFGTLGFTVLFRVRKDHMLPTAVGGFLGWLIYLILKDGPGLNEYLCGFLASMALTFLAELLARMLKAPATTYLVVGSVPLIPGAGLYRTMNALLNQDQAGFGQTGIHTFLFAAAMAGGITAATIACSMYTNAKKRMGIRIY